MPSSIVFVTSSDGKFREAIRLAPFPLERANLDLVEPQSLDLEAIVRYKAREAHALLDRPLLVEDASLELESLGGFPGPLVKWVLRAAGVASIPRILSGSDSRRATARAALAFIDSSGVLVVQGATHGTIVPPRGTGGFGWDAVFLPDDSGKTFSEMTAEEKDRTSHRGKAFAALTAALRQRVDGAS